MPRALGRGRRSGTPRPGARLCIVPDMIRPLQALIDPASLTHNLARVRESVGNARVWAVVKADAYGHGLGNVVPALSGADGFALVEFDAALRLRAQMADRPILMLEGAFDEDSLRQAVEQRFELMVHSEHQIAWIEAQPGPRRLRVWLKFNAGMNRLGFSQSAFRHAYERLVACPVVDRIGLATHFANADLPGGTIKPLNRFTHACEGLPGQRCMANSAACLLVPGSHSGWVRPGIMLYGASPMADRSAESLGLRPAMHLESRIIAVQTLLPGDEVGYGGAFTAGRPMRIGVVACGYGDGYPRSAATGTPVWVAGRRTRLVGRVSMDMLTVDLDPVPQAGVGVPVQLWGNRIAIDEVARHAGTIGYELMCRVTPRVPRVVGSSAIE